MIDQIFKRELGIGEILSNSWNIYLKQFKNILIITLLIYVPINILLSLFNSTVDDLISLKLYFDIIRILEGLFGIIVTMGIAVIVKKAVSSEDDSQISWGESIKMAFSRWGSCIGTNILGGLIIFGLTLLLVVPGIIWSLYYAFVIQVVILKNLGGKEALDYSKSLVKGQWWKVFGTLFVIGIMGLLIILAIGFISGFLPDLFGIITDTIIDIVAAYFTVATTIYFINVDYLRGNRVVTEKRSIETDFQL